MQRRSAVPRSVAHYAAALLALAVAGWSAPAPAGEVPIFLGAIGVGSAKPEVGSELRSLLRAELGSPDFVRLKTRERYRLSATLVRLDSVQSRDSVTATCVLSVALLRDGGATLFAVIHGRASAEEARERVDEAQRDALRGAVHSAMKRVPLAVR